MNTTYALPVFPSGTGLGNRLFHWCDAKIYSYKSGCRFISPLWCRVSLGRHLRSWAKGQWVNQPLIDYANVFRCLPKDVPYCKGVLYSPFSAKIHLSDNPDLLAAPTSKPRIICFDKSRYSFQGYCQYRSLLVNDLMASIRPQVWSEVLESVEPYIGIHARVGDGFKPSEPGSNGFIRTGWLQQTPIQWFQETLRLIRRVTGVPYRAYVFSDGSETQLKPLLEEDNVFFFQSKSPVIDLLSLSRSWLILGSGSSSFSAFAAFLGSSHAITAPGHPFTKRGLSAGRDQVVGSVNPRDPGAEDWLRVLASSHSL